MNRNFELLAPAGDFERLETALRFGADAVYCGGPMLQLRAGNVAFSMDELQKGIQLAHSLGKKVYVTVNAFAYNEEIEAAKDYAQALRGIGFGQTRTYGEIAAALGKPGAARAVGRACGKNPLLIVIPCHRVIGSGGKMTGFAAGIEIKRALLSLERADIHA